MHSQQHILLIEDDVVDVMTVRRSLQHLGVPNHLDHAADGEQGLEFLRNPGNVRPGLILLDLNMPCMNGIEFLAAIKKDAALRSIPVVVLTTSQEASDRIDSFEQSVAGYMIKPADYQQFVETMRIIRDYWSASETTPS